MNNDKIMTPEEHKAQQELDSKPFSEIDTDEKFNRLIRTIQENNQNANYMIRRVVQLETEVRQLKGHEHGNDGSVVIKIKELNNYGGSDVAGVLSRKSLLA